MRDEDKDHQAHPPLDHVEAWLFDLDNTLYPHSCNLFAQIDVRMKEFICDLLDCGAEEAHRVQKSMFHTYGTTMRGLMSEHAVKPDDFLAHVHEIDHSPVPANPALSEALGQLDGVKHVFTNASVAHAEKVLDRLGVAHHFSSIFDIVAAEYRPKPDPAPYRQILAGAGLRAEATAFFDDIPRNLEPAHELGWTTVWIRTDTEYARVGEVGPHIHYEIEDLAPWLSGVASARSS
ncbi:MAG: pyrimidine 5'-nucleotidase [Alphaproteobacteria bacterium]